MRISDWSSDVCSSDLLLSVVLRESLEAALTGAGLPYAPDDGARLIQAVKDARPFDDVAPALERLRTKYKTAILSNSERAMLQHNRTRPGLPLDRKSAVWGKSVYRRVDFGGRRCIKKK